MLKFSTGLSTLSSALSLLILSACGQGPAVLKPAAKNTPAPATSAAPSSQPVTNTPKAIVTAGSSARKSPKIVKGPTGKGNDLPDPNQAPVPASAPVTGKPSPQPDEAVAEAPLNSTKSAQMKLKKSVDADAHPAMNKDESENRSQDSVEAAVAPATPAASPSTNGVQMVRAFPRGKLDADAFEKYFSEQKLELPLKDKKEGGVPTAYETKTGFHALSGGNRVNYSRDLQTIFTVPLNNLPPKSAVEVDADASVFKIWFRKRRENREFKTEILCVLESAICSGSLFTNIKNLKKSWHGKVNTKFFGGTVPETLNSEMFSKKITDLIVIQNALAGKENYFQGYIEISLEEFLGKGSITADDLIFGTGAEAAESRSLTLAVADDTYFNDFKLNVVFKPRTQN